VVTWNAPASLAKLAATVALDVTGLGAPFAAEFSRGRYALAPRGIDHHLVIQAEADETVPLDHGLTLHAQAHDPRALLVLTAADHRLTDITHRRQAIARSLAWFSQYLPLRAPAPQAPA
jgi:hypothetical protein